MTVLLDIVQSDIQGILEAGCSFILMWFIIIQLILDGNEYSLKIDTGHVQNSAGVPLVFQNRKLYV
jgi:hypothetical protein